MNRSSPLPDTDLRALVIELSTELEAERRVTAALSRRLRAVGPEEVDIETEINLRNYTRPSIITRDAIVSALTQCAGSQSKAAKLLGIARGTFIRYLDRFGLPRPRRDTP